MFCWFLAWIPKINRWFLFFFFTGSNPLNSFSFFFSLFFLCDRVEFAAFSGGFTLELQRKWFGDDDSLMNLWEPWWISLHCAWTWLNLVLEKVRVCGIVLRVLEVFWVWWILILTEWREKILRCLWCGVNYVALFSDLCSGRPFIDCHVCLWTNEMVTSGLDCSRGIWTEFWLKDLSTKNKTKGLICKRVKIGLTAN